MTEATLTRMASDLTSQDNAATHHPIFVVQRHRRVYGFDPAYSDDQAVWLENDDYVEISDFGEYSCPHCEKKLTRGEFDDDECLGCQAGFVDDLHVTHTAYQDSWESVQPFFTRAGAEEYLRVNGHNLQGKEPPRIYVDSAFRNSEWQALRALLLSGHVVAYVALANLPGGDDVGMWVRVNEVFQDAAQGQLSLAAVTRQKLMHELGDMIPEETKKALSALPPHTLIGLASDCGVR